jgi:type II secretory pathway pseudopilin PulG
MHSIKTRSNRGGLTLIEIIFVMALVSVVAYLSLSALTGAGDKGASHGLAMAVKENFEGARQTAIKSGQPVALGIPTDGGSNLAACSLYRLQGWNTPYVKWSGGFAGDYPDAGFAAAIWAGAPAAGGPAPQPVSAKYFNFGQNELLAWLPDGNERDYIFCYLPDGSLITNNLPTSGGRYTVVIAQNPTFGGSAPGGVTAQTGTEPWTLFVSPGGGVEIVKGTPGASLPPGVGDGSVSPPQARTKIETTPQIYLSEMIVEPESAGQGHCTPGQVVTLEIYAHCPEGDELYANWTQVPGSINGKLGSFTYPHRDEPPSDPLPGEADRMEFIPPHRIPTGADAPNWSAGENPAAFTGIFRARWTWTVPLDTDPDEVFSVTANVQNASSTANIVTSPVPSFGSTASPKGKLIVERRVNGQWTLWRMNPDGTNEKRLSPQGVQEMMPSIDRHANQMVLVRDTGGINQRYIVVRGIDGQDERILDGPGAFTSVSISPTGDWVAYRDNAADLLIVTRTNGSETFNKPQAWGGTGFVVKKGRPGWSTDGRYVLFGSEFHLYSVRLDDPAKVVHEIFGNFRASTSGMSRMYSPCAYQVNGQEHVVFSGSGHDGFLCTFPVSNYEASNNIGDMWYGSDGDLYPHMPRRGATPATITGSAGQDDDYPSVSYDDPPRLMFTSSPDSTGNTAQPGEDAEDQNLFMLRNVTNGYPGFPNGVFYGPVEQVALPDVRRAIFLPPE